MLNKEVLESIFEKLLSQAKKSYDEFNAADGKIGDGDLGITIFVMGMLGLLFDVTIRKIIDKTIPWRGKG